MKKNQKIAAFTLTEILVVIVISAIVAGLAFSVLDIVQRNFLAIRNNFNQDIEKNQLKEKLAIDFHRYQQIELDRNLQRIRFKNPVDSTFYSYSNKTLITGQDTTKTSAIEFYFDGNKVADGKVDALKLYFKPESFIFIYKKNDIARYLR